MKENGLPRAETALVQPTDEEPTELSIDKAGSVAEIKATLAKLKEREKSVTARLNELVSSQNDLSRELGKLDLVRAQLGTQAVATRSIGNNMLSDAASTAKRISGAVQQLDLEQSRVKATLSVVEQVAELKACVHGVNGSMGAPQDWETAAGYLNRASKIPKEIIEGSFAEQIVPSSEVPDTPSVTLENAAESLCSLFLREFEKAAKEDNGAKVTRFFKLFPLIGRSEVGLDVYGRYVCQGVASHARANLNAGTGGAQRKDGFFYASALTKLFEYIAQIVDRHGGLVERHYGEGRMVRVIERLQIEADLQGGIVIDAWSDERNIDRKLTDIRSYAFTFLVQSFLSVQTSRNPMSRSSSPAVHDRNAVRRSEEDEGADMKDVDGFLNEISVMLGRWSLYCRFIATKCADPKSLEGPNPILALAPLLADSTLRKKVSDRLISPFNQMSTYYFRRSVEKAFQLDESPADLSLSLSRPLGSNPPYISSAVDDVMYIANQVVSRALATSQRDVVASSVPDVARVLSQDFIGMVQRKMRDESYPRAAVAGGLPPEHTIVAFLVLANNLDVANAYLARIVAAKLESSDAPPPPATNGHGQGQQQPKIPEQIRASFPFAHDAVFVAAALRNLSASFSAKSTELLGDAIQVLHNNVMKPRLRPVLADAFRDVDYSLTEAQIEDLRREAEEDGLLVDAIADPDAALNTTHHKTNHNHNNNENSNSSNNRNRTDSNTATGTGTGTSTSTSTGANLVALISPVNPDAVPLRFRAGWQALARPIARLLTEANWERLLDVTAAYLAGVLEKRIWAYYGRINALGALRLERDVAALVGAVVRGARRYGLRDHFLRCTQICLVMNMEEDEWDELKAQTRTTGGGPGAGGEGEEGAGGAEGDDGMEWQIDAEERDRAKGIVKF